MLPAVPAYALLSWLPVGYLTRTGSSPQSKERLSWPFWGMDYSLVLAVIVFAALWLLFMAREERWWTTVISTTGMTVALYYAWSLYLQYEPHYGPVSDRATALQYGWEELSAGRNPYYRHTQLDNTISPMLGGIILAGPFVLLNGDMYWQQMVFLALTLLVLSLLCGPRAGCVAGALLVFSPAMRLEMGMQSDGWVNAAALALSGMALYLLAGRCTRSRAWWWLYVAASLLFALAFSYRFIYAVLALPLAAVLWRHHGLRVMLTAAIPAAVLSAALIFGPWLADPDAYAPFTKATLGTSEASVPQLPLLTAIACVTATVVGTLLTRTVAGVWGTMAAVSLTLIVMTGWGQHAWYQYLTYAYNGGTLIFLLFALLLPLRAPAGVHRHTSLWEDLRAGRAFVRGAA